MADSSIEETKKTLVQRFRAWGANCEMPNKANTLRSENSFPPTVLASLIFAQHARPFQLFPMLFPPVLLFTSYANIQGFKTDSAGIQAAWSGLYLLLAGRRRQAFAKKLGPRGIVRGMTMGLCLVNMIGGGLAYTLGKREEEEDRK
ncbi:uncharacterized protein N7477_009752 [Penicillium maclennaniae]|uniref:uncharacterized protein n=1 Tax=Penicillium maclennaniae TaxID=1343394 RepID=UPI00253FC280|nr:uncharacterized protein N7477_009752 [Penicillium maclennaniae]KAJ5662136.1 hypothetical protein N7477_009752 [Penicillium maclennaniae]